MATIPVVGFVSLGCPKALVDTERIVTELRARGYRIGQSYRDADLVIVNTCGFVNEAIQESLEAIAEALRENGRVIVSVAWVAEKRLTGAILCSTRCLKFWASRDQIRLMKCFASWNLICLAHTSLGTIWSQLVACV